MPFTVLYLCSYRPVWYEDGEYASLPAAVARARQIYLQRRTATRIVDWAGRIVWESL